MEYARIDARVLAFTLAISFVTAVVSGLWPAWKASAVKVSETLKLGATATTGASRSQVRDLLAITEIAAAVTLLVASGLVVKSFVQLSRADWGFNPENLLLIGAKAPRDRAKDRVFHLETAESIRARLETIPGVERVAVGPQRADSLGQLVAAASGGRRPHPWRPDGRRLGRWPGTLRRRWHSHPRGP